MSSVVRVVDDTTGARMGAAWLRTLRLDGSKMNSVFYRVGRLPGIAQPRVKVAFPLENGSAQVWLTPRNDAELGPGCISLRPEWIRSPLTAG
jgi:hypothetical protein